MTEETVNVPSKDRCLYCDKVIEVRIFQGTGLCSENHRKAWEALASDQQAPRYGSSLGAQCPFCSCDVPVVTEHETAIQRIEYGHQTEQVGWVPEPRGIKYATHQRTVYCRIEQVVLIDHWTYTDHRHPIEGCTHERHDLTVAVGQVVTTPAALVAQWRCTARSNVTAGSGVSVPLPLSRATDGPKLLTYGKAQSTNSRWGTSSRGSTARTRARVIDQGDIEATGPHVSGEVDTDEMINIYAGVERTVQHELKVLPPYFDALVSGSKTFEIRKNDRGYQRGDLLRLREWHPERTNSSRSCRHEGCGFWGHEFGHWSEVREVVERRVSFVFSGDPRFGGIESGYVVLALEPVR